MLLMSSLTIHSLVLLVSTILLDKIKKFLNLNLELVLNLMLMLLLLYDDMVIDVIVGCLRLRVTFLLMLMIVTLLLIVTFLLVGAQTFLDFLEQFN